MNKFQLTTAQKNVLFQQVTLRSDRIIQYFLIGSFVFGMLLAGFYDTWSVGISVGLLNLTAYFLTKYLLPQGKLYQYVGAGVLGLFMAQFIYQMHGLFEMHFFAFVACTVLITYSNWRLQLPLLGVVVIHHAVFGYLQFIGVPSVYFTQLPYMDLVTFGFHVFLAGIIIGVCGLWAYYSEEKILEDGIRAMQAEESLRRNLSLAERIKSRNYDLEGQVEKHDALSLALGGLGQHLKASDKKEQNEKYIQNGVNDIGIILQDLQQSRTEEIASRLLSAVAQYIGAQQASIFLTIENQSDYPYLEWVAGYAFKPTKQRIEWGEGLIGQTAKEAKAMCIQALPDDYFSIQSSLGSLRPNQVISYPLLVNKHLVGVMEFATLGTLSETQQAFLNEISSRIAAAISMIESREKAKSLLKASEKLQAELQDSNQLLEVQTAQLKKSEKSLKAQQKRLLQANTELENQKQELESQKQILVESKAKIELAKDELEQKTEELKESNKYKSEFLANMSHELRTPLNSILILARILGENKGERLDDKEVAHAQVIHKAGSDLLTLINDILDLSKVESGKMIAVIEEIELKEVLNNMESMFRHVAEEKQLTFSIETSGETPLSLATDRIRLEQILKNLLSNAFKFTSKAGKVHLQVFRPEPSQSYRNASLQKATDIIGFSVKDTGIGIPKEKQAAIFEAFQQADGSTSREYGGTGLGLSICLQLSELLGGEIQLASKAGLGSTFSLFLPFDQTSKLVEPTKEKQEPEVIYASPENEYTEELKTPDTNLFGKQVEEDNYEILYSQERRKALLAETKILLVDDDIRNIFALSAVLEPFDIDLEHTGNGREAIEYFQKGGEADLILMDIMMPEMDGYEAISTLKENKQIQSIPILAISATAIEGEAEKCLNLGAEAFLNKPLQIDLLLDLICQFIEKHTDTIVKESTS